MVRKRKKKDEQKIFCYYCDRVFADEATLIQHQRAKHFKCDSCHKKLSGSSGLVVHCFQVHKVAIERVPNAIAGRDNPDLPIFGMSGVPEDVLEGGGAAGVGEAQDDGAGSSKLPRMDAGQMGQVAGAYPPQAAYSYGLPPMQSSYPGYAAAAPMYMAPHLGLSTTPYHQPPPHMQQYAAPPMSNLHRPPSMAAPYAQPGYEMQYAGPRGPPVAPGGAPAALFPAARPGGSLFPAGGQQGLPGALFPAAAGAAPSSGAMSTVNAAAALPPTNTRDTNAIPGLTPSGPVPSNPASTRAATEPPNSGPGIAPQPVLLGDALLLWGDEETSMEERRASLPKYVPPPQVPRLP